MSKPRPKKSKLNARQAAFCRAYFAGPTRGNATQSAKHAGYTGNDATLSVAGSQLLGNPKIADELDRLRSLVERETIADATSTLLLLSQTQRGETRTPISVKGDGTIVYGPPKHSDRIRAAELRAKMLGELRDSVDVALTGKDGAPIAIEVQMPPSRARAELVAIFVARFGIEEGERRVRELLNEPEPIAVPSEVEGRGA